MNHIRERLIRAIVHSVRVEKPVYVAAQYEPNLLDRLAVPYQYDWRFEVEVIILSREYPLVSVAISKILTPADFALRLRARDRLRPRVALITKEIHEGEFLENLFRRLSGTKTERTVQISSENT